MKISTKPSRAVFFQIVVLSAIILISCSKSNDDLGTICFDYSPKEDIKNGTEISFMNCSDHAAYFLWMFGDGTTSFEKHPKHVYSEPGTYHILLIAQNRQFRDLNADMIFSQLDAEQADSTSADIQVVN